MAPQVINQKLTLFSESPVIQRIKRILELANLLHWTTTLSPLRFYLIGLVVGIGLLVSSIAVGMASFMVDIEIETINAEKIPRTLDLGYVSQMNYGVWYLVCCPILLAILACAYDALKKGHNSYPQMLPSLEYLGKAWWISVLGIAVLSFFVFKNVIVEWGDYKSLSLGWVQALPLEQYRGEMEKTGVPIDLVARGKKFDRFLLPRQDRFIQKNEIRSIKILKIDPELHVKSFWGMVFFILATKIWVGLWEAIVIYFAIITLVWGLIGVRRIDLTALKDAAGSFYHLSWIRRPAFYIFLVGLLVNVFCIFRYMANAVKGSYGKWDQYWSFLIFSPALFLLPLSLALSAVFNSSDNEEQAYMSKKVVIAAGLWSLSFAYVIYLLAGYINPRQQTIIVACFKPFIGIFKKVCGF